MFKIFSGLFLAAVAIVGMVDVAVAERPLTTRVDAAEKIYVSCTTDISPTSQCYVPVPFNSAVTKLWGVNSQTLAQGASDTTVSLKVDGVAVSSDSITITSGTAVGGVISATITQSTSSTVDAGDAIEIESDGGLSSGGDMLFILELDPRYP